MGCQTNAIKGITGHWKCLKGKFVTMFSSLQKSINPRLGLLYCCQADFSKTALSRPQIHPPHSRREEIKQRCAVVEGKAGEELGHVQTDGSQPPLGQISSSEIIVPKSNTECLHSVYCAS